MRKERNTFMTKQSELPKNDRTKNIPDYRFFYWGPLLFKIKLNPPDLKKCAKLCSKKESNVNEMLAGIIKHEHYVNHHHYYKILDPYLGAFRLAYRQWYGNNCPNKMTMQSAWVNFMKAGEFNPPHIHSNCDFSSVLFVKIPEKLREEHKKFVGSSAGPGAISFLYGDARTDSISHKDFLPEEGDFFMFPATLKHFVAPFMSKGERISISANFRVD